MNEPHFDNFQFESRSYAVSAETRITYQDYSRMQTYTHKASGERRLPTPLWALNDTILRELLCLYLENRLYIRNYTGTFAERRERIRLTARSRRPRLIATLDKLQLEYVVAQQDGAPQKRLKELEMEIENLDTQIRTTENGGMAMVAAVVYLYHRTKLDSVGVGTELGIKPPMCRQILWKMDHCWKKYFNEDGTLKSAPAPKAKETPKPQQGRPRSFDWDKALEMHNAGMSATVIGAHFGVHRKSVHCALANKKVVQSCSARRGRPPKNSPESETGPVSVCPVDQPRKPAPDELELCPA